MEQTANIVSFPGLGWEFEIDRVAFHIGSLPVYWYGILIALGFILAILYVTKRAKEFGVDPDRMLDVVLGGAIGGIVGRGRLPFLVGGTGLYVRAVAEGFVFHAAPPDPALRAELEALPTEELRARLAAQGVALDVDAWNNRPRLVRLLEKARTGGDPHAEAERDPRYDVLTLGVSFPRETVCRRIDDRLLARLDAGMVEEVAALRAGGVPDTFLEGLGLEYRYILWYLQGKLKTEDELVDELGRAIKRFAKRQVSWFKKDKDVHWLDMGSDPAAEAGALIDAFLV